MLEIMITAVHVMACIFLVLVVLLQTGKGAEMGAVFGGSSSTVFGSSGAGNFLTRLTTATAIIFMVTSLSLTYISAHQETQTIFDSAPAAPPLAPEGAGAPLGAPAAQPAAPEAAAPAAPAEQASAPAESAPAAESAPQAAPAADPPGAAPAQPAAQ